ncbi:MAG: DNA polymerase III subunit delta' [Patescibacteria group bacterium]
MTTQVIGHNKAQTYLQNSIKQESLTHAYLFCGPPSVGKTTLVSFFIERLFNAVDNFSIENNPDILWIKNLAVKKDISIDQIREIKDFLKLHSWNNNYRVVIIQQADKLNKEAGNALLKTLEEPTTRSLLILIVDNIHKLLPTIVSRCQVINLTPVNAEDMREWLSAHNVLKRDTETVIHLAQGNPGVAWNIINDENSLNNIIKMGNVLINFIKTKSIDQIVEYIQTEVLNQASTTKKGSDFVQDNKKVLILLKNWLEITRDLLLCKYQQFARLIFYSFKEDLVQISELLSVDQIVQIIKLIEQARAKIMSNSNTKLTLEWLLISIKTII